MEIHVTKRDAGEDDAGPHVLRVHGKRVSRELTGAVEIERSLDLHAREHHERVGGARGYFQRLGEDLFGMGGIILVEVE
ncbi:MAG: hypothetical protein ACREJX_19905, partial [Polyangiaceae bacterium]